MALTQCPDCGNDLSDLAPACPNCGRPAAARPVTVEATAKRFKRPMMLATVIMGLGFGLLVTGGDSMGQVGAGGGIILLGLIIYGAARFGGWWHHG